MSIEVRGITKAFGDFVAGRVWSLALDVDEAAGTARLSDLRDHTEELGGRAVLGNVSAFGTDADGEMYVVNYVAGVVLRVIGPAAAPPAPSNLRIVR